MVGGFITLRLRAGLPFILSFTAGVLLGVVSFEILPEIYRLAHVTSHDPVSAMIALVAGFLLFHSLEKLLLIHGAHEHAYATHYHPRVGVFSALALVAHSAMDGVGIGLAFQVSRTVGVVVAFAVITHDFCDGMNTIGLMLTHRNSDRRSLVLLGLDALAPMLGAASTLVLRLPSDWLMLYLGFFGGVLLYIGASDILPEAHSQQHPRATMRLVGLTCLGALVTFTVVQIIS
jgi:ZIP family zinc transporter